MADGPSQGASRVRKPQQRQPQAPPGGQAGAPRGTRAAADGGAGVHIPSPSTHPPNPLPPGQVMVYPRHPQQHAQHRPHLHHHLQHPQHPQHLQHPQHPPRMGLPGTGFQHPPPPPPPPPAFFPGSASLFEQLDKRVMVVLRDGRHLVGVMRSYDQFSNIVLEDTHERHFVGDMFGDIALGLYLVRGDALVLMGELDAALEETPRLKKVSADEIIEAQQETSADDRQGLKLDWLFQDLS